MAKVFKKIQKALFWGHFGPFLLKRIFLEKRALLVLKYSNYLPSHQLLFWKQLSQRKSLKRNITTFLVSSFHECHLFENNFYFLILSPFISVYFLSFRRQKIKNITKNEQKRLLLFPFLVSFIMAFLAQKLIHAINI